MTFKRVDYISDIKELYEKGNQAEFEQFMKFDNRDDVFECKDYSEDIKKANMELDKII